MATIDLFSNAGKKYIHFHQDTSNALQNLSISNESLIKQVESVKQELEHHFQLYHCMLDDKQKQIISQLDAVLLSANDLYKKRSELIQTQGELEEKVKSNRFHDMKVKMLEPLLAEMSELERSISRSEREVLELEWKDSQLGAAIEKSCVVLKTDPVVDTSRTPASNTSISYGDRQIPVWSVGNVGNGGGESSGVAIDSGNQDIYVSDRDNNRIIIFNKNGNFVRNLLVLNLKRPHTILLMEEYCYIACDIANKGMIVKVCKKSGINLAQAIPGINMIALAIDNETKYLIGCPLNYSASMWKIKQDDLKITNIVGLQTPHYTQGVTQLCAVETTKSEIFILFSKSLFLLQSFTRDGLMLRNIIGREKCLRPQFFAVDSQSDNNGNKVIVFSSTGEFKAFIGKIATTKRSEGEVYSPRGVAITVDGHVFVCDGKFKNKFQLF